LEPEEIKRWREMDGVEAENYSFFKLKDLGLNLKEIQSQLSL